MIYQIENVHFHHQGLTLHASDMSPEFDQGYSTRRWWLCRTTCRLACFLATRQMNVPSASFGDLLPGIPRYDAWSLISCATLGRLGRAFIGVLHMNIPASFYLLAINTQYQNGHHEEGAKSDWLRTRRRGNSPTVRRVPVCRNAVQHHAATHRDS